MYDELNLVFDCRFGSKFCITRKYLFRILRVLSYYILFIMIIFLNIPKLGIIDANASYLYLYSINKETLTKKLNDLSSSEGLLDKILRIKGIN